MFTPLSTGSERAQDKQWDRERSVSSRKPRVRPTLPGLHRSLRPARPAAPLSPARAGFGRLQAPVSGLPPSPNPLRHTVRRRSSAVEDDAPQTWSTMFFRVDGWLSSFWKRHFVLTVLPCIAVWIWVAVPFPVNDPYHDSPLPRFPSWPRRPRPLPSTAALPNAGSGGGVEEEEDLPVDVNFFFFLFCAYLAVALFFITNLFSLYRLNWWPQKLGGKATYGLIWSTTLLIGFVAHQFDLFSLRKHWKEKGPSNAFDWERKTFWVVLSFAAMHLPALACFSKLRRDRRHVYRHAQPVVQYTFFGQSFRRIPSSWVRFLWFMACLAIASFSLIAGQAVQLLAQISFWILSSKVRSRALLFVYKLFFQLVYHVFYRNLFATVQLLSSISVIVLFPLQMTKIYHRALQVIIGYPQGWAEHAENVAIGFYCRGLAQNVTMLGFLGWLAILHFGPNSQIYPFFKFSQTDDDPYTFAMTFFASLSVWVLELLSSFIARQIMFFGFTVDVAQIGLDEMREYPELVPACCWASLHVSMNILLFLIKLNFR